MSILQKGDWVLIAARDVLNESVNINPVRI